MSRTQWSAVDRQSLRIDSIFDSYLPNLSDRLSSRIRDVASDCAEVARRIEAQAVKIAAQEATIRDMRFELARVRGELERTDAT